MSYVLVFLGPTKRIIREGVRKYDPELHSFRTYVIILIKIHNIRYNTRLCVIDNQSPIELSSDIIIVSFPTPFTPVVHRHPHDLFKMHFFNALSLITLALATFTSAAPVVVSDAVDPVKVIPDVTAREGVSISGTLAEVSVNIGPLVYELEHLVVANATSLVVSPIVKEINTVLKEALDTVNFVSGDTIDTVDDIVEILAPITNVVFAALAVVLRVVSVAEYDEVVPLLSEVGSTLGQLLQAVFGIVTGVRSAIIPLIREVLSTATTLQVAFIVQLLS